MSDKIQLEIVTPRGRALSTSVDEVTAPSVNGEFGVMPGHLPLLAALRTGLVSYRQGGESKKCAIGPGFAEVGADKLLILTDEYIEREAIDPVVIRKQLADVQSEVTKLEAASFSAEDRAAVDERQDLVYKESWLAAQLELYGDPPPATMRPHETWGPPPPPEDEDIPADEPTE